MTSPVSALRVIVAFDLLPENTTSLSCAIRFTVLAPVIPIAPPSPAFALSIKSVSVIVEV